MLFTWKIKAKGIGPFEQGIESCVEMNNSRVVLYAANGRGKTCLSRMFALAEYADTGLCGSLITRGQDKGRFEFSVESKAESKKLLIQLNKKGQPQIDNETGYRFHVFNSDYVIRNLAERRYVPSSEHPGYIILGDENISLDEDRDRLSQIESEGLALKKELQEKVDAAREELFTLKVSHNLTELALLEVEKIITRTCAQQSYDSVHASYEKLQNIPENVGNIVIPSFDTRYINLNDIKELLQTSYQRANFGLFGSFCG